MRITLHQLTVFLKVKETASVTEAAKQLHMTQPAVSNIIKQLEAFYQTQLTEVKNRQTQLTAAGYILAESCQKINHIMFETENKLSAARASLEGNLSMAVVSTAKYFFPRLLAAFKKQHPHVKTKLVVCNREEILQRIKDKADDFYIMSQPPKNKHLSVRDFYHDKLVVVASANSPLLQNKKYSLRDLASQNWLIREPGSGTRMVMEKVFKTAKLKPHIISEVSNNESIKQFIIADMGISIVSLQSIELELENNLLQIVPIKGFPKPHPWFMVHKPQRQDNETLKIFNAFVESHSNLAHFHSWKPIT